MNTKDAIEIIQGMISVEYACKSPQRDREKLALELARKALEENARLKAERDAAVEVIEKSVTYLTPAHDNSRAVERALILLSDYLMRRGLKED